MKLSDNLQADTNNDERGEGVISAAIAVLIFALIGAAMWTAYSALFKDTNGRVKTSIDKIADAPA
jgi:hypothetical protein